jgi:hypothetical protein
MTAGIAPWEVFLNCDSSGRARLWSAEVHVVSPARGIAITIERYITAGRSKVERLDLKTL